MTYARLDRCDGPPCPNCGCADAEILEQPKPAAEKSWWGSGKAVCRQCGTEFRFKEAPDVEHQEPIIETPQLPPIEHQGVMLSPAPVDYKLVKVPLCPACRSEDVRVTTTRANLRYYKCQCGETFKRAKDAE